MSLPPHVPASPSDPAAVGADLSVRLGPLDLAHPIINASGTMEIFDLAEVFGGDILERPPVAAYVPKTVTVEARDGNAAPRILETAGGMINAIGLSGEGIEAFVRDSLPRLLRLPCPLIVSVGGFSVDEYTFLASRLREALEDAQGNDWVTRAGLELNISCPNVHSGCVAIGSDPKETYQVVSAVKAVWPGLLEAKLTPNVADISAIGRAAETAGADALAAVNTFAGLVIDRETLRPYLGNITGGLSGPAIKPLALRAVYELFKSVSVPIVAIGGIATVQDVLEFISCGARVVAVGSAAFREPALARRLSAELEGALAERGYTLTGICGLAHNPG
jgi:dihydroorotate dehydrogenase (NAD+) catalytic subunit